MGIGRPSILALPLEVLCVVVIGKFVQFSSYLRNSPGGWFGGSVKSIEAAF